MAIAPRQSMLYLGIARFNFGLVHSGIGCNFAAVIVQLAVGKPAKVIKPGGVTGATVAHRTLNPLVLGSNPRSPISNKFLISF